jgi:uncharacterized protein
MSQPTDPQQPVEPTPTPGPTPPAGAAPQAPVTPQDERTWSIVAHIGGVLTSFVAPLVVWLAFRDRSARLAHQGKQALNFQLTLLIGHFAGAVLTFMFVGPLVIFATWACSIVFGILAAIAASRDELYTYPFAIPFVK